MLSPDEVFFMLPFLGVFLFEYEFVQLNLLMGRRTGGNDETELTGVSSSFS